MEALASLAASFAAAAPLRSFAANHARQMQGLECCLVLPPVAGPDEPLTPRGDEAPVLAVAMGELQRERVLGELRRRGLVVGPSVARRLRRPACLVAAALGIAPPQPLGLVLQPVERPGRIDPGLVVGDDLSPGLARLDVPLAAAADPVSDHSR